MLSPALCDAAVITRLQSLFSPPSLFSSSLTSIYVMAGNMSLIYSNSSKIPYPWMEMTFHPNIDNLKQIHNFESNLQWKTMATLLQYVSWLTLQSKAGNLWKEEWNPQNEKNLHIFKAPTAVSTILSYPVLSPFRTLPYASITSWWQKELREWSW